VIIHPFNLFALCLIFFVGGFMISQSLRKAIIKTLYEAKQRTKPNIGRIIRATYIMNRHK
jgi:hypothetical protein